MIKPPCTPVCKKNLQRWHLSCLTCPTRRVHYHKTSEWRRWRKLTFTVEAATSQGFIMPTQARTYAISFPQKMGKVRRTIIKNMLTLVERIAEW